MEKLPVIVGYDGSPTAETAMNWALAEAARREAPLRLVYVFEWAAVAGVPVPSELTWPDQVARDEAVAALDEAVARARAAQPAVPVTGAVVDGLVMPVLSELSARAALLVVGHRGLGGFTGLLAGAVAIGTATHAHCPVVVVRGAAEPELPVVVGVDESSTGGLAIDFAFEQAAGRGVDLVAVRAWQPPPLLRRRSAAAVGYDADTLIEAETERATSALRVWKEKYPKVHVVTRVVAGGAAHALVTASEDAQLVVAGARGRGGFRGLRLGSVPRQVLAHAHCPVAVVRPVAAGQ